MPARIDNYQLFSVAEYAKICGISRVAMLMRIKKGKVRFVKVGRAYIVILP